MPKRIKSQCSMVLYFHYVSAVLRVSKEVPMGIELMALTVLRRSDDDSATFFHSFREKEYV